MKPPTTALLLVGSPKPKGSTSEALGTYVLEALRERGVQGESVHIVRALGSEEATEALVAAVASADLVILSFPLYVDSLPAPVIRALELIAARRRTAPPPTDEPAAFMAMTQCGFPEAEHNEVALEICHRFAAAAGFTWAGGLALGAGGMIDGRPLREAHGLPRWLPHALNLAADALAAGRPVPEEATRLMTKAMFPAFLYRWIANRQWRAELKKRGAAAPIDARPFA